MAKNPTGSKKPRIESCYTSTIFGINGMDIDGKPVYAGSPPKKGKVQFMYTDEIGSQHSFQLPEGSFSGKGIAVKHGETFYLIKNTEGTVVKPISREIVVKYEPPPTAKISLDKVLYTLDAIPAKNVLDVREGEWVEHDNKRKMPVFVYKYSEDKPGENEPVHKDKMILVALPSSSTPLAILANYEKDKTLYGMYSQKHWEFDGGNLFLPPNSKGTKEVIRQRLRNFAGEHKDALEKFGAEYKRNIQWVYDLMNTAAE